MYFFLFKTILSIILLILGAFAGLVMYELLGRRRHKYEPQKLRGLHKISGRFFLVLTLFISALCIGFIVVTRASISLRGVVHSILAIGVLFVLFMKIAVMHRYRQHYQKLPVFGILLLFLTIGAFSSSAGYFLSAARSMTAAPTDGSPSKQHAGSEGTFGKKHIRSDQDSILRGKELYDSKCAFCHDVGSAASGVVGPGHKGILRNPLLPVSKKPATPENIAAQIRTPYKDMPAFPYLSDSEIADLIAYMNTL